MHGPLKYTQTLFSLFDCVLCSIVGGWIHLEIFRVVNKAVSYQYCCFY